MFWLCLVLKKEEEERTAEEGSTQKVLSSGKVAGPDLKSFICQFPSASSEDDKLEEASDTRPQEKEAEEEQLSPMSTEPTGSGASYRPGTWQPPI
ncbi:hypothetical protein SLEP1_g46683 [Rubroshorea leprosula]|uniref:NADH dehydrogenase [ubiquinone] 1 alpha subcomplex subunit 12 n=1 Tax=Rubroshorea leprosula TaxID=152421 RepID=A0AAV5LPP0_9ROSI|nr:hypothetical protein SLEP1_g46683 [Rubroshorea leprosula]